MIDVIKTLTLDIVMKLRNALLITFAIMFTAAGCERSAPQAKIEAGNSAVIPNLPSTTQSSTIDWTAYPQSEAFKFFMSRHPNGGTTDSDPRLLIITWLLRENVGLEYTVTKGGHKTDVRHVYNWAYQNSHSEQIDSKQLERLANATKALPISNTKPPLQRLVVVTRNISAQWRTDLYDAQALPQEFENILSIIGERFETRDRIRK